MLKNYETKQLETDRLIIKKGTGPDCIKIYEYDMLKCRGIADDNKLVKANKEVNFIGDNPDEYYEKLAKSKMYDWYIYLKGNCIPIGNITADRENDTINSIELSYNMHPDYWNNGYMIEAVSKVIDYLFEVGYSNIISGYDTGNYKSKSFAEKLGFCYYQTIYNSYQKNNINIDSIQTIMPKEKWLNKNNEECLRKK